MLSQRVAVTLLGTVAIAMLIFAKTQEDGIDKLRLAVAGWMAPVYATLSEPVAAVNRAVGNARVFWSTYDDNSVLREELRQMQEWRSRALSLEQQNRVLRAQLHMTRPAPLQFITARVLSDTGGPFLRTRLLRAGTDDGVEKGQAVVASGVLVGKIVAAGRSVSRLLLLTDLNARVPVMLERLRERSVLAGDNSDRPKLLHLRAGSDVAPGDQVVTSGNGGLYPPGLPVGRVSAVGRSGIEVSPFADFSRLEYVTIVLQQRPAGLDLPPIGGKSHAPY